MKKININDALQKIKEKCEKCQLIFHYFSNDEGKEDVWRGSHKTHLSLECKVCGYKWHNYTYHSFINSNRKCKKCGGSAKLTLEEFIEKSRSIHGDKYDYSKVQYVNNRTKVCIICPIHGEFWQIPSNHLKGYGCNECGNISLSKQKSLGYEIFVKKARKIHGNLYDYIDKEYVNNNTNIQIKCNKCTCVFFQKPIKHLLGHGCPKCKVSHLESEIRKFLEEHNINFEEQKHFEWLGSLSLDFYLPQHNIAIECQGIQHFEPRDFSGHNPQLAVKMFEHIKERDERKRNLCELHGIKLLYYSNLNIDYPYTVYEDKNELLKEVLT